MRIIKAGKWLDCGCCGNDFLTWKGYQDQDQDDGYGICKKCQGLIAEDERKEEQKLIDCFAGGLNEENRKKYLSYPRKNQLAVALQALEDGEIKMVMVRR